MNAKKCSSKNPATCRYHGHEEQVAIAQEQKRIAEENKDFEGYFKASKVLEALEKKQQIVQGLDAALEEARQTGDFNRYFALAEGNDTATETGHAELINALGADDNRQPIDYRKRRAYQSFLVGSDGNNYINALHPHVFNAEGDFPDRIYSEDEYGEDRAFVQYHLHDFKDYPNVMRVQASRPLTDEEVKKVAQLTGYTHRKTLNGEGLSAPERDGNAAVILSTDNTKSYGRKTRWDDFEEKLEDILQNGSDKRTTNRSGPNTMGTRLIDGLGSDIKFTLYYQDDEVKFPK